MKNEKPEEKFVYRLEEVSRIAKLPGKTIEGWEKEFPFLHSGQTSNGQKIFRQRDVDIILRIKELLEKKGFTLAGAKRAIEEEFETKSAVHVHPDRLKKVLYQVKEQLQEIASSLGKESKKI